MVISSLSYFQKNPLQENPRENMRPKNLGKKDILFDAKLLSDFIYELNISRRLALSYPEGHPLIQ